MNQGETKATGLEALFPSGARSLFFAGVGGMGMAPLAIALAQYGYEIYGYDKDLQPCVRDWLERSGVKVQKDAAVPELAEVVVHSSAFRRNHPLLALAEKKSLPVFRRGEVLAAFSRHFKLIAVVGSHGKTTTTGMLVHYLEKGGFACSYLVGALFQGSAKPPAFYDSSSEWLVAEIDESDGTIEGFSPEITLVLNLDWDHCDQYPYPEYMAKAFQRLCERTRGKVILPGNCSWCNELVQSIAPGKLEFSGPVEVGLDLLESDEGEWTLGEKTEGSLLEVSVPGGGWFNARNGLAVLRVASLLGLPLQPEAWADFPGIRRRQEILLELPGLTVVTDYAHHPGELKALWPWLEGQRKARGLEQVVIVFQSHRYSRTKQFGQEFAQLLAGAKRIHLLETYAASESYLDGGGAVDIARQLMGSACEVSILGTWEEAQSKLPKISPKGELWAFIGAGDVDKLAKAMAHRWGDCGAPEGLSPETVWREGEPLADKTTLRVGGPARFYTEPASEEDLVTLLKWASEKGCPVFPLGRGSNLVVPPEGFPGLVFRLNHPFWRKIEGEGASGLVRVGAGARLRSVCGEACRRGWGGFEFLEGIPATLGGALRMNAGAMGGWVFDVVEKVSFLTLAGEKKILSRDELHYGYRHCLELANAIAVEAWLRPPAREVSEAIRLRLKEYMQKRTQSQPKQPSAGCIFKNPEGTSAGKLIDEAGLKGRSVGAAEVSSVHANFIINQGGATAAEVIELVREVRNEVYRHQGILLEPEVHLPGTSWEEVLKS